MRYLIIFFGVFLLAGSLESVSHNAWIPVFAIILAKIAEKISHNEKYQFLNRINTPLTRKIIEAVALIDILLRLIYFAFF